MKKFVLLSILTTSLILVGCSSKGTEKAHTHVSSSSSVKQHQSSSSRGSNSKKASSYVGTQSNTARNNSSDGSSEYSSDSPAQGNSVSIYTATSSSTVDKSSSSQTRSDSTSRASVQKDFDINAINNGDLSTLVGTWKNGQGDEITIASDGTADNGNHVVVRSGSTVQHDSTSVPFVGFDNDATGEAMALLKIGATNPAGDASDKSKPRFFLAQGAGSIPSDEYYYKK